MRASMSSTSRSTAYGGVSPLSLRPRRSYVNTAKCGVRSGASAPIGPKARWQSAPSTKMSAGPFPDRSNAMLVPSFERTFSVTVPLLWMTRPPFNGEGVSWCWVRTSRPADARKLIGPAPARHPAHHRLRHPTESRCDLPPMFPLVLEGATETPPERANAAGHPVNGASLLPRDDSEAHDERLALSAQSLTDVDPSVIDGVPGRGEGLHRAEKARDVMRLGLAHVPEDVVERATAFGSRVQSALIDALDECEEIGAGPLEPAEEALDLFQGQRPE